MEGFFGKAGVGFFLVRIGIFFKAGYGGGGLVRFVCFFGKLWVSVWGGGGVPVLFGVFFDRARCHGAVLTPSLLLWDPLVTTMISPNTGDPKGGAMQPFSVPALGAPRRPRLCSHFAHIWAPDGKVLGVCVARLSKHVRGVGCFVLRISLFFLVRSGFFHGNE